MISLKSCRYSFMSRLGLDHDHADRSEIGRSTRSALREWLAALDDCVKFSAAGGQLQTAIVSQIDPPSSIEQVIFKKRRFISD
jgi:hypothetical protein